jgi:hypothetical protein
LRDDVEYIILDDILWKDISPMDKGLLIAPGNVNVTGQILSSFLFIKGCFFLYNR